MIFAFADSGKTLSATLFDKGDGSKQSHEGVTGQKAQSVAYAATLKAQNPDGRSVYAKVAPGEDLEYFCNEIEAIFGEAALKFENNPLLAPFFLVVSTSGNEFRHEKKNSKLTWNPEKTEKNKITYERYKKDHESFSS